MGTSYEADVIAWATEQVALLRGGRLSEIDAAHIAEEIEDVAISVQRALASRMSVLIAHLLKWQRQPVRRGHSWETTIRTQRQAIARALRKTPSLRRMLDDADWLAEIWGDAVDKATKETALHYPEHWIWSVEQVLDLAFLPD